MSDPISPPDLRRALLAWYDRSGRTLPWRLRPEDRAAGKRPDPYAVWLAEIMLQQTTVPHATPYYHRFLERWPTVQDLAAAESDEVLAMWAGLGYYARARNLMACAGAVAGGGGNFPTTEKGLLALPGIGPYTAAAMLTAAYNRPAVVVDGNVERVITRLYALETLLPRAKSEIRTLAGVLADPDHPGDYAQAIMDLGATVCSPTRPVCALCPWVSWCAAHASGSPTRYPRKSPPRTRPVRHGVAFFVARGGGVWLRKRPSPGLLGGMLEIPSTVWREEAWDTPEARDWAPFPGSWGSCGVVRHVFTHFTLLLEVWCARSPSGWAPLKGGFHPFDTLETLALPTLMRKVVAVASENPATGEGRGP